MTEADLLYHFILIREQLDAAIAQTVGLTLALVVGIYYFLHKAGWRLKLAVFIMYLIGWYVFVISGALAGEHMQGILGELAAKVEAGEASRTTQAVVESMSGKTALIYVITANLGNFVLLIAAASFLFLWKPPVDKSA